MSILLVVFDIYVLIKFKRKSFRFSRHKAELITAFCFSLIFSLIKEVEIIFENSTYKIHAGFPFNWLSQIIKSDPINQNINILDITNTSYRIDILIVNVTIIYLFIVGIKKLMKTKSNSSAKMIYRGNKSV